MATIQYNNVTMVTIRTPPDQLDRRQRRRPEIHFRR